jgi:pimeloyl-ACP methyl ester carboxylesterase
VPRRVVPLLAVLVAVLGGFVAPSAGARTFRCGDEEVGRTRCTRVAVPLDRTGAVEGRIGLSVRTIEVGQTRARRRREAVLFLAGGPGQAATSLAADLAPSVAPLVRTRDLVTVDTRGTGRSTDLIVCPELETAATTGLSTPESFRSCARRLGPAADRYGTTDIVQDLEAVRVAGGYDRLLLVGVSYGTYIAQRYAAAYPTRVSGMVLDSAVDVTGADPYSLATFRALPAAVTATCRRRACRGVTNDPAGDLERVRARLPLQAQVDGGDGRRVATQVTAETVITLIQTGDLDPVMRAALPSVLRRAGEGDPAPLARLARESGVLPLPGDDDDPAAAAAAAAEISTGSYVATLCRDVHHPWTAATPTGAARNAAALAALAGASDADRAGWTPEQLLPLTPAGVCAEWPSGPDDAPVGPAPDVPTLVLSGSDDTRTSPEEARRVAHRHPGTVLVSVPGQGHSTLTSTRGCVAGAIARFAKGRPPGRCHLPSDLTVAAPLPPRSPAELGSTPTARARAVATATVVDALRTVVLRMASNGGGGLDLSFDEPEAIRVAGLRSGSAVLTPAGRLLVRRMGYVPGTAVTATLADAGSVVVDVRGRGLRPGRYRIPDPTRDAAALLDALGIDPALLEDLGGESRLARIVAHLVAR